MRVGIVCPYDWSHPGGVRTHIRGLAEALAARGIGAEIIAPASGPAPGIFPAGSPVPVPANGSVARICLSRSARRRLAGRLELGDLDLLHLHEPAAPSVSLLALTSRALPAVATFHAAADRSLGYALARPVLDRALRRVRERIAVSEAARRLVARYFPGDYRLIPNGVEGARFAGASPDPELTRLKPFVLFVGRAEPRKGLDVVVRAMGELRREVDARLVVSGTFPANLGEPWLVPLGGAPDERLPGVYAAADALAAPSLGGESFGYVLVEAMAAGCPVVASDLAGYREAAGYAAVLVPPGDERALAGALRDVLTDPGRAARLVEAGRRRAAGLDWSVLVDDVLECYETALRRGVS